ncbi:G protein-coupled receptor-4B [Proboscivirus elephantidbeta4]|uniref:G protein-coupled receptor-4B n=1 Tax=Elephant endotheliotropic herpesvirus 4 TaxID=548914 RepID=A0A0S1TQI3_9BETA|nr:G protein-coupled receptor-4B [Elephant endotheliotropic herpesvirus 4]ALM25957.1 G protein-coupled receptor-4B [Elephant endotheliotropic herpesvirus 4]
MYVHFSANSTFYTSLFVTTGGAAMASSPSTAAAANVTLESMASAVVSLTFGQAWDFYLKCMAALGIVASLVLFCLILYVLMTHRDYPGSGIMPVQCYFCIGMALYLYLVFIVEPSTYLLTVFFGILSSWLFACLACHAVYCTTPPKHRDELNTCRMTMYIVLITLCQVLMATQYLILFSRFMSVNQVMMVFDFAALNMTIPIIVMIVTVCIIWMVPPPKSEDGDDDVPGTGAALGPTVFTTFLCWVIFFGVCASGIMLSWYEGYVMLTVFTSYLIYMVYGLTEVFNVIIWLDEQKRKSEGGYSPIGEDEEGEEETRGVQSVCTVTEDMIRPPEVGLGTRFWFGLWVYWFKLRSFFKNKKTQTPDERTALIC